MLKSFVIPNDLAACQRLLAEQARLIAADNRFTADSNERSGFVRCDASVNNTTLVV